MSESDSPDCPLCMELFEIDDLHFYPCTCGYQICRFCWHRIRTVGNGLCPACRKEYTEDPAHYRPPSQEEIQRVKKERKKTENQRKQKVSATRQHLSDIRVIQKHLVFVVGLSNKMADVETLCQHEYFGKYGKILKIVINPNTHYAGPQGPSASAYITYKNVDDALKAITAINNMPQPLKLRASLGTTKYCSHYLRNMACPKPDCMYLHDVGDENASFTKEDMQAGKHQLFEKNLLDNYASKTSAKQDHHHHVVSSKKPILINSTSNNTAADDNSQAHNHRNSGEEWEDGNPLLPSQASWGKESHMTQARSTKTPEPKTVVALSPKKIPPGSPSKSRPLSQNLSEPKKTVNKKTSVVKEDPKTNAIQPTVIQKPPPQPQLEPQLQKLDNQSPQTGFPQNTPQSLSQNLQNMPPQSLPQSSLPQNPPPNLSQQPISAPPNLHQKPLQNSAQHLPPQITQTAKDLQQQQQQQQDTIPQQPTANVDIPAATAKTMSIAPPPGVSKPPAADFPWSLGGMDLGLSDLQISASDDELGFDPFRESKCGLEDLMALEKQQGVTAKKPAQPSFSWDSFFPSDFVQNMCNQQQQQSYSLFGLGAGLQQQQQPRPPPSMHPNSGMVGGYPTGGGRYNHPYANHPQFAQMNASGHPATPQFPGAPPQPPQHHQPPPRVVPPPPPGVLLPGAIGPEADKNWQEGLRALLPNINISFGNPGGVQSPSEPPAPSNNSVTNLFTLPPGFASLPPPVLPPATVAQQIPPVQQQSQPPAGQQWNRAVVPPAINEGKPLQQQNVRPPPPPGFSAPVQQQQQMQQQLQQQQQLQIQQQQQRLKEQEQQKLQKIQQQQQQLKLQQQQHQQIFCNIQQNVIPQPQQQVAPNKPTPGIITVPPTLKSSVLQNSSTNHAAKQQQGEDPSILWSRVLADEQKDISTAEMSFPLPGETQDRPLHQVHRQPSLTSWNTVAAKQTKPDATPDIKQSYALHISTKDEQAQQQPQQKPSPIFGSQQKHAGLKNKPTAHVKPLKNNNSQNDGFTTVQGGASSGRVTVQNNPPPQQQQLQQPPVANSNQQQQQQQSWRVSELDDFSTDFPAPINSSAVSSNKMKKKKKKGKEMVEPVTSETIVGRVEVCIPEEERPKKQKNKNKTKTSPTQTRKVVEPAPAPLSTPLATPLTTPIATKQPIRILKSDGNNSASNSLTQAVAERSSSSQEQEIVSRFTESTEKLLKNVLFETEAIKLNTEQISKDLKSALQRCKESSLSLADLEKINILLAPGNIGAGIDDFVDTSFLERQVESARREAKVLEARLNEVIRKNMASELETLKRNTKK